MLPLRIRPAWVPQLRRVRRQATHHPASSMRARMPAHQTAPAKEHKQNLAALMKARAPTLWPRPAPRMRLPQRTALRRPPMPLLATAALRATRHLPLVMTPVLRHSPLQPTFQEKIIRSSTLAPSPLPTYLRQPQPQAKPPKHRMRLKVPAREMALMRLSQQLATMQTKPPPKTTTPRPRQPAPPCPSPIASPTSTRGRPLGP